MEASGAIWAYVQTSSLITRPICRLPDAPRANQLLDMAARKDPKNLPQSYELQRAKQLLNRLTSFSKGEVEMSAAQVQAARIVIGKEIPDKKAIEHSGNADKPIAATIVWGSSD